MADLTPVPGAVRGLVDDYVRTEIGAHIKYDNRRPLDTSGIWSLRRLVERAYLGGYNDGHFAGTEEERRSREFEKDHTVLEPTQDGE